MDAKAKPGRTGTIVVRWIARGIIIAWAAWWIFFSIASGIAEMPDLGLMALITHLMVPVEILLTLYVAWRWELAGGILLLAEVLFAWYFFNLHEPKQLFVALTLALPAALAGVLFISCWLSWRRFAKLDSKSNGD
jgi:hypothetical protein